MRQGMKEKIIRICDSKIASKGSDVGLSFYAFFANKNEMILTHPKMEILRGAISLVNFVGSPFLKNLLNLSKKNLQLNPYKIK